MADPIPHPQPTIIRGTELKSNWLLRDHVTAYIGREHTGGRFGISVNRTHPGDGPPPHIHGNEDEGFYILEGEMTFLCGDRMFAAGAGTFVWGPRNVIHAFRCSSETPAKSLLIVTPTDFFDFAATMARPADDFAVPPTLGPDDIAKLMSVTPQYGIQMCLDHTMPTVLTTAPAASKQLWVMGEHISYLATSEQTARQFTIVEIRTAPGGGPPPHRHAKEDELFYVIEGRHDVLLGSEMHVANPGDLVFIPRGTLHQYSNLDTTPGRLLSIHTPGGFESFFDECGVNAADHATAPTLPALPRDAMEALLARHGMTV